MLQALTILTEMLRDQRGAKLRSFVLPAVGEIMCLIVSQVCVSTIVVLQHHSFAVKHVIAYSGCN